MNMTRLQCQALQRFAIAAAERERALKSVAAAERAMWKERSEALRHGGLQLPITATLLDGQHVLISTLLNDPDKVTLSYTITPPLLTDA